MIIFHPALPCTKYLYIHGVCFSVYLYTFLIMASTLVLESLWHYLTYTGSTGGNMCQHILGGCVLKAYNKLEGNLIIFPFARSQFKLIDVKRLSLLLRILFLNIKHYCNICSVATPKGLRVISSGKTKI